MPFGTNLDSQHLKSLERRGWWPRLHSGLEEFIKAVQDNGGWWDPLYAYGQFGRVVRTSTGRYRFPTESEPRCSPPPDTPVVAGSKRGLAVHAFPLLAFAGGSGGELPWLQPSVDTYARISWQPWVELNPRTAAELGIEDGQEVEAGNKKGQFRVRMRVFEGAMPGLLNVPIGFSPHSASRYADESGPDFFSVIGWARDPVSGLACLSSTPVSVRPA
jgi:anaerobic selenocysteine-containing dehydrogenase